jgi:hypothetical protein
MDSVHKQMPAFISFLPVYVFCIGSTYCLLRFSSFIDNFIFQNLARAGISQLTALQRIPFSAILSLPFALYAARTLLWNLMSRYEIGISGVRLLTGSLTRKEIFYPASILKFEEISFEQNLLEAPFDIGTLVLKPEKGGNNIFVKGVTKIKLVVKALRSENGMESSPESVRRSPR